MVRSDIQILREEIRRIATEFNEFKAKSVRSEKAMTERIRQLTLENDALKLKIAKIAEGLQCMTVNTPRHLQIPRTTQSVTNSESPEPKRNRRDQDATNRSGRCS